MTPEVLQWMEANPIAALLVAMMAVFFILLWGVCAGASKLNNPFDPERHCSTCKHRPGPGEPYLNETCVKCLECAPIHSEWEPKA